jgi:enterochelin esterase-like enzyme
LAQADDGATAGRERSRRSGNGAAGAQDTEEQPGGEAVGRGRLERLTYTAKELGDRPAVAMLYVPAQVDRIVRAGGRLPVVVFLHGIPGAPEDWLAGGDLPARLDEEIATGRFPAALAVMPDSAAIHDPKAGWTDAPHQPVLRSLRTDLLPALARRFPSADLDPGHGAVVGVGRGAAGAVRLAALDRRFGFAVAIGSNTAAPAAGRAATLIVIGHRAAATGQAARTRWAQWRAELPRALRALEAAGFGGPAAGSGVTPSLARAGEP